MSISLSKEDKSGKNLYLEDLNSPKDNIKLKQNNESSYDFFKEPDETEDNGIDIIANKDLLEESSSEKDADQGSFSEADESVDDNIFMKESEDIGEEMTYEEIQQEKAYFLSQLKRLESKGHISSRRFGMEHSLNEVKSEVFKIRKEIETDRGINYCRQGLMFCVSTIEMLNTKYDPFSIQLDGWSNVIMADKENYDDVFEELYQKYSKNLQMAPEIKLMSMLAGSALMFHLQKSMIMRSQHPVKTQEPVQEPQVQAQTKKMKGPSINLDDIVDDDFSDISSIVSEAPVFTKKVNIAAQKKRGRPKKNI